MALDALGKDSIFMTHAHSFQAKKWLFWLLTVMSAAGLYWMLQQVDWRSAWAAFLTTSPVPWFWAVMGMSASHWLRAGRIRNEWKHKLNMPWHVAWALMVRHSAWVVLVPMRAGEAIYVWFLHRQGQVPLRQAALSLLRLRIQDMAVLGILFLCFWGSDHWGWRLVIFALASVTAIAVLPTLWHWVLQRMNSTDQGLAQQLPPPAWTSWAYAFANWIIKIVALGAPLSAMLGISGSIAAQAALGGELGATLPVQPPAGFGPYEAGVIFALQGHSLSWSVIAPAALAIHLLALAVTLSSAWFAHLLGWSQRTLKN